MTTLSDLQICSRALHHIGKPSITAFDEEVEAAPLCGEVYAEAVRETLSMALWNFASGWEAGVLLDITPKTPWTYVYTYPPKALKLFGILRATGVKERIPLEITARMDEVDGKLIHTNEESPTFEFVMEKTNVTFFSPEFARALSWVIAREICMPLTKNLKLFDSCMRNAELYGSIAEADTLNESEADADYVAEHHRARD